MPALTDDRYEHCAPELMPVRFVWWVCVAALLMAVLAVATARTVKDYPNNSRLAHNILEPVLALELPQDKTDLQITLRPERVETGPLNDENGEPWEARVRSMFRNQIMFDNMFIACYVGFFALFSRLLTRPGTRVRLVLLGLCAVMLVMDYGENWSISGVLHTPFDALTDAIANRTRWFSLTKWAAYALLQFGLSRQLSKVILLPLDRTLTGLLAIDLFVAGTFGITGLLPESTTFPALFSHNHLTTMVKLSSAAPVTAIAVGVWQLMEWVRQRFGSTGPKTLVPAG